MPSGDKSRSLMQSGAKYSPRKNSRHSISAFNTNGVLKPREAERIALVVKFDRIYQRFNHNPRAMLYLAEWADRHNLSLAHHARAAAKGVSHARNLDEVRPERPGALD